MSITVRMRIILSSLLAAALASASLAFWSAERAAHLNARIELAHRHYETHLKLESHAYQLFKQYGDAMLIGDRDDGGGERRLTRLLRADIRAARAIIAEEIDLVGEEEFGELEEIARIERLIEHTITELDRAVADRSSGDAVDGWARLRAILDDDIDGEFARLIETAIAHEQAEIEAAREEAAAHASTAEIAAVLLAGFALAAALVARLVFRRAFEAPVARLADGARRFAAGDFSRPIEVRGADELARVGGVLNEMGRKIAARTEALASQNEALEAAVRERTDDLEKLLAEAKRAEANRRRLLADVSHELRTPLTIIQGEASVALRGGEKSVAEYREALTRARDAAAHTAQIVSDLLFIARKEADDARIAPETVDLRKLVAEALEMFAFDAPLLTTLDAAEAMVDPARVRQCLLTLLQNARQHAGGVSRVRLDPTPSGYRIAVEDDGPGLDETEKEAVFERFFRGSDASGDYREGLGLGLPIARSIAEAHGGAVYFIDGEKAGATAVIELPKRPALRIAQ